MREDKIGDREMLKKMALIVCGALVFSGISIVFVGIGMVERDMYDFGAVIMAIGLALFSIGIGLTRILSPENIEKEEDL